MKSRCINYKYRIEERKFKILNYEPEIKNNIKQYHAKQIHTVLATLIL